MAESTFCNAIPPWQDFLIPILEVLSDGAERPRKTLIDRVLDQTGAAEAQRAVLLHSGGSKIADHVGWALSDLNIVKAVSRPTRGVYQITAFGRHLLDTFPQGMQPADLEKFPAYAAYKARRGQGVRKGPL